MSSPIAPSPAVAQTVLATFRRHGGTYLGRGNFGQALLVTLPGHYGSWLLKAPVAFDIHGRRWDTAELREAFHHEALVARELAAAGADVVPGTTFVDDAAGFALVREYGAPAGPITFAEWDRLSQRLGAAQDAGWWVRDDLQLFRRRGGELFVGDVGVWKRKQPGLDNWQDDALDWLLPAAAKQHNGRPFPVPSWYQVASTGRRLLGRLQGPGVARYTTGIFRTLFGSVGRELGALVRARRAYGAPVPGEALAALAGAAAAYRARGEAPPPELAIHLAGALL